MNLIDTIFVCDARDTPIPDESVDLIVTSPPYNVGIEYNYWNDNLEESIYNSFLYDVWNECYRVLKHDGRIAINVAGVGRKPYIDRHAQISQQLTDIGFLNRGVIIWNKSASVGPSTAWGSWRSASNPTLRDVHEFILVFSKNSFKKSYKGENDITAEEFTDWTKSIWTFSTVSAKKIGHPAPFPEELPKRLIKLYSYVGDIVYDPFVGSGTTCIVAKKLKRHYIGIDIDEKYVKIANENTKKIP